MPEPQPDLERLAARAVDGDDDALHALVVALQDPIYALCLRMLGHPEDARDACQDILIRTVTRLSSFRGDSRFRTWVYRIAANHLIDRRRSPRERVSFESIAPGLGRPHEPIADATLSHAPAELLAEETFLGCTLALLRCLDRDHRLAFILGAILELDGTDAAAVLDVSPATYRKRLSRARSRLTQFLRPRCSVMNPEAPCHCENQVNANVARGFIDPRRLRLAGPRDRARARAHVRHVRDVIDAVELYRRHPEVCAPAGLVEGLRAVLRDGGRAN